MTNSVLLEESIRDNGIKKGYLAEKLGISYTTLARKINNITSWKAYEISIVCEELHIEDLKLKDQIFFAKDIDIQSTS